MKPKLRTLILEDRVADAELILHALRAAGRLPEWRRVDTEADYLAALDDGDWDVILADFHLPQFDGLRALEALTARGLDIPFILVSGTIGEEVAVEAMRAGASDYVMKDKLARLAPAVERELRDAAERRLRRAAEQALQISERKYRDLFESSRDAIMTLEPPDWRFTAGNPAALAMFGAVSAAELVALGPADLSPERQPDGGASADRAREMIARAMRDGSHFFEWTHRRIGGAEFPATVLLSKTKSGGATFLQATVRDITEKKRMEESRTRLATAVEQAAEAVVITDADANIVFVNPAFEKITGYSRDEVMGKNPRLLKGGKQDAAFYLRMWDLLASGRVWSGQLINRRKDGTLYEEDSTISPVVDAAGKIVNYVGVKHDVTEHRLLETQLRQAQKMETVGQLAGGIAHDFNNLLTIINGTAEFVIGALAPGDPLLGDLDEIKRAGERAAALTRQLLTFSRKQVTQLQVVSMATVVGNVIPMLRRVIGETIELVVVPTSDPDTVKADPGQLEQVLMNLAVNARDAMPYGGRLTLDVHSVELGGAFAQAHGRTGQHVVLTVSDTGSGMDEATSARVFEPFFTTKPAGQGTGLGLSIVYGIVKQSGGLVEIDSGLGRGTSVKIYFPRVDGAEYRGSGVPPAPQPVSGATVLVVEDQGGLRRLAKRMLEVAGYHVLMAGGGEDALAVLAHHDVALLITDIVMPGMSGTKLAQEAARVRPGIKVLYMSGYTDDIVVRHGVLEGQMHFLNKPFTAAQLIASVQATLPPTLERGEHVAK